MGNFNAQVFEKLLAVTTAVALATVGLAAAPANAEDTGTALNRLVNATVFRTVDPTTHQVQYKAGELISINGNATLKSSSISAHVNTTDAIVLDLNITIAGTVSSNPHKSLNLGWTIGGSPSDQQSMTGALTKTFTSVPTGLNYNFGYYATALTDVTVTVEPSLRSGSYSFVAADLQDSGVNADTGFYMPGSKANAPVTGHSIDSKITFMSEMACVDTTSLDAGNVLEASMDLTNGKTQVGTMNPNWNARTSSGMPVTGGHGINATYTVPTLASGTILTFMMDANITTVTEGTSYSFRGYKVVKTGTTTNLLTSCKDTAATATMSATGSTVTAAIDSSPDGMPGFDYYICNLYASSDTSHATVIVSSSGTKMGMNGPSSTVTCGIRNVPAGTYSMTIRGGGYQGISSEKVLTGTVTVAGSTVTPPPVQKTAPTAPALGSKVKKGKTLSLKLHASAGTKTVAKNANGLVTSVALAAGAKSYCSITKVITKNKITGYTVKGLKASATRCQVVVTITGNTTYDSLTRTYTVNVTK